MKYLCFLAYLLINLVNCRFFVTPDYSLQKQVQHTLFLFLCSRFHKAEITSRRILYYVRTYLLLRRDVANATSGRIFISVFAQYHLCFHPKIPLEHLYFAGFRQNVATGGNKVITKTSLTITRYSLIIKELSISVANVALS